MASRGGVIGAPQARMLQKKADARPHLDARSTAMIVARPPVKKRLPASLERLGLGAG